MKALGQAPASVGNVAVGFDLLGHSLAGPCDRALVTRVDRRSVTITSIRGVVLDLPVEAADNTAGRALQSFRVYAGIPEGFDLELEKGIPLGSGLGGSAASAVAALVAANLLVDPPLSLEVLYACAMDGEEIASGSRHGDNVAPMLLGGLVIAPHVGLPVSVPTPPWLYAAVVHPHQVLETRRARAVLGDPYGLSAFVLQSEGLALVLAGCYGSDPTLIRRGLRDVLVEPRRASLIPGFFGVQRAALDCGALGASISGAGPSVFAWFDGHEAAEEGGARMKEAFLSAGVDADALVSPVNGPAARGTLCGP